MKRNAYSRADGLPYFWRTTDQMEVDYLEVCGSKIKAFEFKWNLKKKSRITKAFTNDTQMPKSRPLRRRILGNGWDDSLVEGNVKT